MNLFTNNLIVLLCLISINFGKLYPGLGFEMSTDGAGIYYKQMSLLRVNYQLILDIGFHFENSQPVTNNIGYNNNYKLEMLDLSLGHTNVLFPDKLAGTFKPILMIGAGGLSELQSFSTDNIIGIWMIKYMLGVGFHFDDNRISNEIMLKIIHSYAFQTIAALQMAFYWK